MSISQNFPSVRPVLLTDFENSKVVDPRIATSRATTATYYDQIGILRTAPANTPRINYVPSTGAVDGFLVEPQRTNLMLYSEQFSDAYWSKVGATITANTIVAPDGTLTMDKLVENTSSGLHYCAKTINVTPQAYWFSFYAKAAERTVIDISIGGGFGGSGGPKFDLISGSFLRSSGLAENVGNGIWRISVFRNNTDTQGRLFGVATVNASDQYSYVGDGTSGVYIWGYKLETLTPTSYIKTEASQVTRAADISVISGTNLSQWYTTGTAIVDINKDATGSVLSVAQNTLSAPVTGRRTYGLPFSPTTGTTLTLGTGTYKKISFYPSDVEYRSLITPVNAPADAFVMTVFIATDGGTFQWPNRTGTRNGVINWGDGTSVTSTGDLTAKTYTKAGYYDISVTGTYTAPNFNNGGDRLKVVDVRQWGTVTGMTTWSTAFYGCANLVGTAIDAPQLIGSVSTMFLGCTLFNGAIGNWNTSAVTLMNSMFQSASAFNQDIGSWNTGAVTNMSSMFQSASSFNQDIGSWDTGAVTNMSSMFQSATVFNQDLTGWCVTLIPTAPTQFATSSALDPANYPVWGTCPA